MSDKSQIEELLTQVQRLRDQVQVADRDAEFKEMEHALSVARCEAMQARRERDAAVAELARVKADVAWTMGKLRIKDIMMMKGEDVACAGEGWLPFNYHPQDTELIEWINAHGRAGASDDHWLIAIPHHLTLQEHLPEPYNIRHIINLSRGLAPTGGALADSTTAE